MGSSANQTWSSSLCSNGFQFLLQVFKSPAKVFLSLFLKVPLSSLHPQTSDLIGLGGAQVSLFLKIPLEAVMCSRVKSCSSVPGGS